MSAKQVKAYWCYDKDWHEMVDLVFAPNRNAAKVKAMQLGMACDGCEYHEIRAIRNRAADKYYNLPPSELHTAPIWREIGGLGIECELTCDTCGLASCYGMPGWRSEFAVCPECNQCGECGHDDGCTNKGAE